VRSRHEPHPTQQKKRCSSAVSVKAARNRLLEWDLTDDPPAFPFAAFFFSLSLSLSLSLALALALALAFSLYLSRDSVMEGVANQRSRYPWHESSEKRYPSTRPTPFEAKYPRDRYAHRLKRPLEADKHSGLGPNLMRMPEFGPSTEIVLQSRTATSWTPGKRFWMFSWSL